MTLIFTSDNLLKESETKHFPTKKEAVIYAIDSYQLPVQESNNLFIFGDAVTVDGYFELQK